MFFITQWNLKIVISILKKIQMTAYLKDMTDIHINSNTDIYFHTKNIHNIA